VSSHARALTALPSPPSVRPPALRDGIVPRARLARRLSAARDTPVALLVAPAGYGKTTLLAEWAQRDARPFRWAWRAADAAALIEAASAPQVIVLDDAHLAAPDVLRRIAAAAEQLPRGVTVALAGRHSAGLPIGRLNVRRLVLEIGRGDLAMTRLEGAMLLDGAGLRLDGEQVDDLLARAQGWPAALYLAALDAAGGGDRLLTDYMRTDVLGDVPAEQRAFLRRTAILDRLSGPLCDAVLETTGSAAVLDELAGAGLPIDHPMLAATLRAELRRVEPELEPALHRRAAEHLAAGDPRRAIPHAVAAGDGARAAGLIWAAAPGCVADGRTAALAEWLAPFGAASATNPRLALTAAAHHLAEGRRDRAELALDAAERALGEADPDTCMLRACIARDGTWRMAEDAARALATAAFDSARRSLAQLLEGIARHLCDDHDAARSLLRAGAAGRATLVAALCHAQLALLALELDEADDAAYHAHAASVDERAPRAARTLALVARAVVAAERGELAVARREAAEARRVLVAAGDVPPWLGAEANAWLARAEIRLSDGPAARMLLARAARERARVADAPVLERWIHDGWARADAFAASATGDGPALTNAELRVLRLLPSHLSMREIGERLNVSTNTVKTQTLAVYRKLGVSSRSEAVARGLAAGLV
jgi:LuxR family maltose regulon positive regulatory protein